MKKRLLILGLCGLFVFGCSQKQVKVEQSPPKKDELKEVLKQIAAKTDKLRQIKGGEEKFLMDTTAVKSVKKEKPPQKSVKKTEKPNPVKLFVKKPVRRYSFIGTAPLVSVITYLFGNTYSVVFDDGVEIDRQITVAIKGLPAEEACEAVARRAGYWCEMDGKTIKIKAFRELIFQLPEGFDELVSEAGLGGDIIKTGQRTNQRLLGNTGGGTTTSSGMSANAKISIKSEIKKEDFEAFLKTFLSERGQVKVNWFSKTVYVKDSPDRVESVERFLKEVSSLLEKSIYIEAKLLLVQTSKSIETGIDWTKIGYITSGTVVGTMTAGLTAPAFQLQYTGNTLSGVISMLSQIGKVRELISPKIRTLNLTPAVLVRGTNEPYVVYSPVSTSTGSGVITQTNTEVRFAFNGISFFIKPYALKDKIFLTLQPSISSIGDYLTFTDSQGNTMKIPKTSITSQITKLKMKNDSTVVLGGLVWDGKKRTSTGIPLLDSIPLFGRLFKSDLDAKSKIYIMLAVYTKIDEDKEDGK